MTNIGPKSLTDYTKEALDTFSAREKIRDAEKLAHTHVTRRIILTLVGSGKDLHLEAREDTILERIKIFFFISDYKLERIQAFINSLPMDKPSLDGYNSLLSKKIAKTVRKQPGPLPVPTAPPGGIFGMQNPDKINACFLNSTVQALGKSPFFRTFLTEQQNKEFNTPQQIRCINMLQDIYKKLEQNTVGIDEIQNLRQLLIDSGFRENDTDLKSQEDAGQLCRHMLDLVGVPLFTYAMDIKYNVGFKIPVLDKQQDVANVLPVAVSDNQAGQSLEQLVKAVAVQEDFDKQAVSNARPRFTRGEEERFNALADGAPIPTVQTVTFVKDKEPKILPLWLKRYKDDGTKLQTPITPSYTIDFPIKDHPRTTVRYRLVACVVHAGERIREGHFYTYVPHQERWIEYNDENVRVPNQEQALEDVSTNGYIFYYEYVGRVAKSSK